MTNYENRKLENKENEYLIEALEAVKAAIDSGTIIADPSSFFQNMAPYVSLLNKINIAIARARGEL